MNLGYGDNKWLGYPVGHKESDFGYEYIHENRHYKTDEPMKCAFNSITVYLEEQESLQELNIEEGEVKCKSKGELCFGKVSVIEAVFTSNDGKSVTGLEVNIDKGCAEGIEKMFLYIVFYF